MAQIGTIDEQKCLVLYFMGINIIDKERWATELSLLIGLFETEVGDSILNILHGVALSAQFFSEGKADYINTPTIDKYFESCKDDIKEIDKLLKKAEERKKTGLLSDSELFNMINDE